MSAKAHEIALCALRIIAGKQQCIDNLLSHAEIAKEALKMMKDCTKDDPCQPGGRRVHRAAREVHGSQRAGWPGGDLVTYECPHCKQRFEIELAQ